MFQGAQTASRDSMPRKETEKKAGECGEKQSWLHLLSAFFLLFFFFFFKIFFWGVGGTFLRVFGIGRSYISLSNFFEIISFWCFRVFFFFCFCPLLRQFNFGKNIYFVLLFLFTIDSFDLYCSHWTQLRLSRSIVLFVTLGSS